MSTYEPCPQNADGHSTDPRPRYVPLGTDTAGAHHVYRTIDETILVVENGCVIERFDIGGRRPSQQARHPVDDYVAFVRERVDGRDWQDRRYLLPGETPFSLL